MAVKAVGIEVKNLQNKIKKTTKQKRFLEQTAPFADKMTARFAAVENTSDIPAYQSFFVKSTDKRIKFHH